jgi:hypothetical protein
MQSSCRLGVTEVPKPVRPGIQLLPVHEAALELDGSVGAAVRQLSEANRKELVALWRGVPRLIDLASDDDIIRRYGMVALDLVVQRARRAGGRTRNW